jgi:opacity protein-like surface antigen
MSYRIVCVLLVSSLVANRVQAQSPNTQTTPQTAAAAADFPEDTSSRDRGSIGYVLANVGVSATTDRVAPSGEIEAGLSLVKHLSVVGAYGLYRNLKPSDLQPYVDIAITQLAQRGIAVTGQARQPAQYAWAGVRFDIPTSSHVLPYVMGGAGWAHSTPTAKFTYLAGSGTVNGGTATAGQDATDGVLPTVFVGDTWNAALFRWAAGVTVPVRGPWAIEARYSWSRMSAPSPVTAQGFTAGVRLQF